jgi:hypothetical protein
MQQWISNLALAESVYTEIEKSIRLISKCVAEIEAKMAEVNSGLSLMSSFICVLFICVLIICVLFIFVLFIFETFQDSFWLLSFILSVGVV